jgi:hypothetical protein
VPVDPAALVRNVSSLAALDAEQDLSRAIQQIVSAAEISAAQVYAALAATLLSQAVARRSRGGWPSSSRWRWSTATASSGPRGC